MYRFLIILLFLVPVLAQHHSETATKDDLPVNLGTISFPNSGPAEAQKSFIEGVLLLHSFEYARARKSFQEASRIAPDFALAYWGEAMTYDHPIWGEYDRASARSVLTKLASTKPPTAREKMYLDAVERLFGDGDRNKNSADYSAAMLEITKQFPDDLEAQAFYSLSLLGLTGTTRNAENYMKAAAVAEAVYKKNPRHPGALHYLIHAYDDPVHAHLGLAAARAYGTVARSASHAQHMPSHIFFALGLWEDSIAANTASMKTARDEGGGGYHALHWLMHSYLQVDRTDEAVKLLTIVENDAKAHLSPTTPIALAGCRATMLVETQGKGPESMMTPVEVAGGRSLSTFANHDLARGLEYVRRRDFPEAKRTLQALRLQSAPPEPANGNQSGYSGGDLGAVQIMAQMLESAIQFALGERDEALKKAVAAAEAEDRSIFEYGPPAIVKPAWEQAGEMLLAAGKKKEAADAFRNVLKRYPNRRLSNEGLKAATAR